MFKNLTAKAKGLTEGVELKGAIQSVTDGAKSAVIDQRLKASKVLQANWGKVEPLIYKGLLDVADEKLNDEAFLSEIFGKVYEVLPMPVRLALTKEKFTSICLDMRGPLTEKVKAHRLESKGVTEDSQKE